MCSYRAFVVSSESCQWSNVANTNAHVCTYVCVKQRKLILIHLHVGTHAQMIAAEEVYDEISTDNTEEDASLVTPRAKEGTANLVASANQAITAAEVGKKVQQNRQKGKQLGQKRRAEPLGSRKVHKLMYMYLYVMCTSTCICANILWKISLFSEKIRKGNYHAEKGTKRTKKENRYQGFGIQEGTQGNV